MKSVLLILLSLSVLGCSQREQVRDLEQVLQEKRQQLERTKNSLDRQPRTEAKVLALEKDVDELRTDLGLGPLTIEEPELFSQNIESELKVFSEQTHVLVEIAASEYVLEENGYPVQRTGLKFQGAESAVMEFLEGMAECRTGRLCRLRRLNVDRLPESWSGEVVVDFYLRGGSAGYNPFESTELLRSAPLGPGEVEIKD